MKRVVIIYLFVSVCSLIVLGQSGKAVLADGKVIIFKRFNGMLIQDTLKPNKTNFITHFPTIFNGEIREIQFDKLKLITFINDSNASNVFAESKTNVTFSCSALIQEISLLIDDELTNELIVRSFDIGKREKNSKDPEISKIIFD